MSVVLARPHSLVSPVSARSFVGQASRYCSSSVEDWIARSASNAAPKHSDGAQPTERFCNTMSCHYATASAVKGQPINYLLSLRYINAGAQLCEKVTAFKT